MRYAVIMAGGAGTRLWPMSTKDQPKQLIPFINGHSLLEEAANRLTGLIDEDKQYIGTGESYRKPINDTLPRFDNDHILGEPAMRDTVNAVGLAAAVLAKRDPDAVFAVFTADHLITPVEEFQKRVQTGFEIAEQNPNLLVTFGIKPTYPSTAFGYLHLGKPIAGQSDAFDLQQFKEKPRSLTARSYYDSGQYLWNSGMFVWRAQTLLDCIAKFKPESYDGLMKIQAAWDTPDQQQVLNDIYPTLPKISVDFAVMEPASKDDQFGVASVVMPVDWIDVGSWINYAKTCPMDEQNNAIASDTPSLTMDSHDCIISSSDSDHLIATVGVEDLIIVHTKTATLICHRDDEQRIKELHEKISDKFGGKYL